MSRRMGHPQNGTPPNQQTYPTRDEPQVSSRAEHLPDTQPSRRQRKAPNRLPRPGPSPRPHLRRLPRRRPTPRQPQPLPLRLLLHSHLPQRQPSHLLPRRPLRLHSRMRPNRRQRWDRLVFPLRQTLRPPPTPRCQRRIQISPPSCPRSRLPGIQRRI